MLRLYRLVACVRLLCCMGHVVFFLGQGKKRDGSVLLVDVLL